MKIILNIFYTESTCFKHILHIYCTGNTYCTNMLKMFYTRLTQRAHNLQRYYPGSIYVYIFYTLSQMYHRLSHVLNMFDTYVPENYICLQRVYTYSIKIYTEKTYFTQIIYIYIYQNYRILYQHLNKISHNKA